MTHINAIYLKYIFSWVTWPSRKPTWVESEILYLKTPCVVCVNRSKRAHGDPWLTRQMLSPSGISRKPPGCTGQLYDLLHRDSVRYTWINVWKTLSAKACIGNHASSLLYPAILQELLSCYLLFSGVQFHEQDRKLQWTQQEGCSNSKPCLCIDISWDISYWLSVTNNRHVRISWVWVWPDSRDFQNLSGVQEYVAEPE